jgi:hypothetical protein
MKQNNNFRFLIFLSALVSVFVGMRFSDVGKDTEQYIQHFNSPTEQIFKKFEIGFSSIMYLFSKNNFSVEYFFFFISFLITSIYLFFFKQIHLRNFREKSLSFGKMIFFFSLLLLSSWYFTMITNGLRQGVALVFLYYSLFELFYNNRKFKFLLLFLTSISFHYSVILALPFLLLKNLRFRVLFAIWLSTAVCYIYGVNELIIKFISEKFNLPIYNFIKLYSLERGQTEGGLYNGFNIDFFIYTVFWPLLLIIIIKMKFRLKSSTLIVKEIFKLLKIYFILSIPYFIFGFGPFSNRYAMLAWFLLPVLQYHIINSFNFKNIPKTLSMTYFSIIFLFFLLFTLDWVRLLN